MAAPVTAARIAEAAKTLDNAKIAAKACREAGLPFFVACALLEKESGGKNVYGHDKGGALAGFPGEVNKDNFAVFEWLVFTKGQTSNGVGPCQITYKGYFPDMKKKGLDPWDTYDNMLYGFQILALSYAKTKSWERTGTAYNGASVYGKDLAGKITKWKKRFGIK